MRTHLLCVEIECHDAQPQSEACDRLKRWLETYGHTASGHGFTFINVSTRARKIKTRPSTRVRKDSL